MPPGDPPQNNCLVTGRPEKSNPLAMELVAPQKAGDSCCRTVLCAKSEQRGLWGVGGQAARRGGGGESVCFKIPPERNTMSIEFSLRAAMRTAARAPGAQMIRVGAGNRHCTAPHQANAFCGAKWENWPGSRKLPAAQPGERKKQLLFVSHPWIWARSAPVSSIRTLHKGWQPRDDGGRNDSERAPDACAPNGFEETGKRRTHAMSFPTARGGARRRRRRRHTVARRRHQCDAPPPPHHTLLRPGDPLFGWTTLDGHGASHGWSRAGH
eukprot:gene13428-biopygen491